MTYNNFFTYYSCRNSKILHTYYAEIKIEIKINHKKDLPILNLFYKMNNFSYVFAGLIFFANYPTAGKVVTAYGVKHYMLKNV